MSTVHEPRAFPFGEPDGLRLPPLFATLREEEPMVRVRMPYGGDAWLVLRYDDVKTVLADPRFSRAATVDADVPRMMPVLSQDTSILSMDPPHHTRLRKLVAKAFTARRTEILRPRTEQIATDLLDAVEAQGPPVDLVQSFALPLPITVICELLGVPQADRADFRRWSDGVLATTSLTAQEMEAAMNSLLTYMAGLVAERRRAPTGDVLGTLVRARDEDDRLTEDELVDFGVTLLIAGHETTANQIGNFVAALFRSPPHLAALRADPGLVPAAVEEMLRLVPLGSGGGFVRIALEDVELKAGLVRRGEAVMADILNANRDGRVFADPEVLDFHRENNPHLMFGHGVHHCVGAQLARMELQVAITALLRRFPSLELDVPADEVEFSTGKLVRGPVALPVRW
ncbi:cytochrome P450 [Umezawaea beigongshangensis]|uniref:cytochrome P450 n=1 Tax=Umezawaea beigongshangensis TaxID=2780383 RepID=UPI0018F22620|nr:cytochrome P450 [Umezawaea beigongshangensis]